MKKIIYCTVIAMTAAALAGCGSSEKKSIATASETPESETNQVITEILSEASCSETSSETSEYSDLSQRIQREITDQIPAEALAYAEDSFPDAKLAAKTLQITQEADDSCYMGTPFIIYSLDQDAQDEIYYFPVQTDEKVVYIIALTGLVGDWTFSASPYLAPLLNDADYINKPVIFYATEDCTVAENPEKVCTLSSSMDELCTQFQSKRFKQKIKDIGKRASSLQKVDVEAIKNSANGQEIECGK